MKKSPHILIAPQVFPPEAHPTAVMIGELARHLVARGFRVTVAAGYPHHPHGRLPEGLKKRLLSVETTDGVRVFRVWHLTSPNMRIPVRAAVMVSQAAAMSAAGMLARSVDVVLSVGPPFAGPLFSAALARHFGAALVTVVYDIYPDIAIESGQLSNSVVIRIARALEMEMYEVSDAIIVLSDGFRRTLTGRGVAAEKVHVVPVWLSSDVISPMDRDTMWRRELLIPKDKFVVLYAGTLGLVSGAEVAVQAAEILRTDGQIQFLFVGEGRIRESLELLARNRRLDNVRFLPFQPRRRLSEVQASADVSLVTLGPGRGRTSVPSKVLGYMAAGRPVIASVDADCDTAELVRRSGAGIVVAPGDAKELARGILELRADRARRRELGAAGRRAFERQFSRDQVLHQFEQVLCDAAR